MNNMDSQIAQVIREAIKLELGGRAFFDHAVEMTDSELGKKTFRKLAKDEMDHLNTFGKLFSELIGGEEWKRWVQEEKQKDKSSLIEEMKPRLEKKEKAGELEAISIGMELERKAIEFFENSAKETKDQKAKEIFNRIADEERFHYDLLQAQYDSVNNSGFWLDVAEFKMDSKF
ncbi:MAG: hypothetical protein AMJ90_03610 [candidate division Zixibacteria bacterium SM23_73_2]|nr:MAG: hypothetical protein AMJ90_03610 [candidate division Zixibacteria bacterium SM23_73_2]